MGENSISLSLISLQYNSSGLRINESIREQREKKRKDIDLSNQFPQLASETSTSLYVCQFPVWQLSGTLCSYTALLSHLSFLELTIIYSRFIENPSPLKLWVKMYCLYPEFSLLSGKKGNKKPRELMTYLTT